MELRRFVLVLFILAFATGCGLGGKWTDTYNYHFEGTTISEVTGLPEGGDYLPDLESWTQNRYFKTGMSKGFGHNAYDWTTIKGNVVVRSNVSSAGAEAGQMFQPMFSGTLSVGNGLGEFELARQAGYGDLVINELNGEFVVSEAQATLDEISQVRQHRFTSTRTFSIHWVAIGHINLVPIEFEFNQTVHAVGEFFESYNDVGNDTYLGDV